jgi:peptidyl-tRNA hydrolase, PTH1 family
MLLLVGLGNPGPSYKGNRHNIGFMAVDAVAALHGFGPWRARFQAEACEGRFGDDKVVALKPQTYMNLSGQAVGEAMRFYKLTPAQVFVVHDELDLPAGKLRVKIGGGHGGHNGLRDIDSHIGKDYWRIRLGIGHPGDKNRVTDYVLSDFAKSERVWLEPLLDAVAAATPLLLRDKGDSHFLTAVTKAITPPPPPRAPRPPAGTLPSDNTGN